jgi:hypothetical protein
MFLQYLLNIFTLTETLNFDHLYDLIIKINDINFEDAFFTNG